MMKFITLAATMALASMAQAQQSGPPSNGGSGGSGGSGSSGSSGSGSGAGGSGQEIPHISPAFLTKVHNATIAHGTIMCLAFVIFFPLGAFVIRLGRFRGVVYVHAGIQLFAYAMALAGMGLGVYVANAPKSLGIGLPSQIGKYHPIIGLTIIAGLLFQPALGYLHHIVFVRQHRRSVWSTLHVWWGRIFLTLAIVQGGLGLRFAADTHGGEIAYGVVAGVVWVSWFGMAVWHDLKTKRKNDQTKEVRKGMMNEEMMSSGEMAAVTNA